MNAETIHPAALGLEELLSLCEVRRVRRSGPGGQRRNKVETGMVLRHLPTGIIAEANERRSLAENRKIAFKRLRVNLALCVRREATSGASASRIWQLRCRNGQIVVSLDHVDYAAMLAEALDIVFANDADVKSAAIVLGCTASQLTKFLKSEPRALSIVNSRRGELGLHRLK